MDFDFDNEIQVNKTQTQNGYYHQYCRLFLANLALTNQIKQVMQQKKTLKNRLIKYQDQECMSQFQKNQKGKRFRRNAHQIQRFYRCTIKTCAKSYGSQGSLNQHYKLKHPQIYVNLPNVQSSLFQNKDEQLKYNNLYSQHQINQESNSKVNSILKELGDIHSFKSFKIEQLKYEADENYQNKQNMCSNIPSIYDCKSNKSSQKPQFISFMKKQQSIMTSDGNINLKRSQRAIKKKNFNF